jgi:sulfur transfer protein SufE
MSIIPLDLQRRFEQRWASRFTHVQDLEEMAAKLLETARKLPPGPERHAPSCISSIDRLAGCSARQTNKAAN